MNDTEIRNAYVSLSRPSQLEWLARLSERMLSDETDPRLTCIPAALRADAVTPEHLHHAHKHANHVHWIVRDPLCAARAWAVYNIVKTALAAVSAEHSASQAFKEAQTGPDWETERDTQIADLRDLS